MDASTFQVLQQLHMRIGVPAHTRCPKRMELVSV